VGVTYANGQLPLPNGAYSVAAGGGIGAIYVPGLSPSVEEWSASKSPYYTYGDPVLRKGLVYYLNYAWDGSTVGPPESQVDAYGNRVWSLKPDGDNGAYDQIYSNLALKANRTRLWGLLACHRLFYENYTYGGKTVSLFEHGLSKDSMPKAYYNYTTEPVRSYSVSVGANGIPTDFYKLIITHNTNFPFGGATNTALGIFDSLKDFPYQTSGEGLGALYYSESISYTLEQKNWWLQPEYDDSSAVNRTFTYTDTSGGTVNRTISIWMAFVPETLLGRTYSGAFRVYRKIGFPNTLIERFELDSITPLFSTD
jgi:hypothetical protein